MSLALLHPSFHAFLLFHVVLSFLFLSSTLSPPYHVSSDGFSGQCPNKVPEITVHPFRIALPKEKQAGSLDDVLGVSLGISVK